MISAPPPAPNRLTALLSRAGLDWFLLALIAVVAHLAFNRNRVVSGTPAQVHARLAKMAAEYDVDEITAVTITADFQDRLRSDELLAEVLGLTPTLTKQEAQPV